MEVVKLHVYTHAYSHVYTGVYAHTYAHAYTRLYTRLHTGDLREQHGDPQVAQRGGLRLLQWPGTPVHRRPNAHVYAHACTCLLTLHTCLHT